MINKIAAPESLKAKNGMVVWLLVSADIVVIFLVLVGFDFSITSISGITQPSIVRKFLFFAAGPLVAVLLNDFFPSGAKASIVFWRLKDVLPGHRAFSEHAETDPRINVAELKEKIGEFPENPRDQNSFWYKIFQKHQSNVIVSDSHKRFLLFRDSACLTLLIIVPTWIALILSDVSALKLAALVGGLVLQFLWLSISARNSGIRLVQNVLALESSENKRKNK